MINHIETILSWILFWKGFITESVYLWIFQGVPATRFFIFFKDLWRKKVKIWDKGSGPQVATQTCTSRKLKTSTLKINGGARLTNPGGG